MATIKEDYISFETAKLLKEKWFKFIENKDELSIAYIHAYTKEGKEVWGCYSPDYCPCITMNMAMKWLREVHNLHITTKPYITTEGIMYVLEIYKLESDRFTLLKSKAGFEKSEKACEAAIKYCLENLI